MPRRIKSKSHELSSWVRVLLIICGVFAILLCILMIIPVLFPPFITVLPAQIGALVINIISGVVNIVLGVILLIAFGVISSTKNFSANWFILIVVGVVMLIFGGIAGILVIIAGILDIVGLAKK
jgi:hypothetical protein